jgi:hypothetical protein
MVISDLANRIVSQKRAVVPECYLWLGTFCNGDSAPVEVSTEERSQTH